MSRHQKCTVPIHLRALLLLLSLQFCHSNSCHCITQLSGSLSYPCPQLRSMFSRVCLFIWLAQLPKKHFFSRNLFFVHFTMCSIPNHCLNSMLAVYFILNFTPYIHLISVQGDASSFFLIMTTSHFWVMSEKYWHICVNSDSCISFLQHLADSCAFLWTVYAYAYTCICMFVYNLL